MRWIASEPRHKTPGFSLIENSLVDLFSLPGTHGTVTLALETKGPVVELTCGMGSRGSDCLSLLPSYGPLLQATIFHLSLAALSYWSILPNLLAYSPSNASTCVRPLPRANSCRHESSSLAPCIPLSHLPIENLLKSMSFDLCQTLDFLFQSVAFKTSPWAPIQPEDQLIVDLNDVPGSRLDSCMSAILGLSIYKPGVVASHKSQRGCIMLRRPCYV